ncbi:MAG: serine/threonine protein kinase, partial [Ruminococcus sp.]|nr:serine/threonine protein kinase [Ruminococcus sp.]
VKEFFPLGITVRDNDSATVSIHSTGETETFKKGAEKFYDEARMVAKFNGNSSIVSVYDFFYENATVYYTMEYLRGQTVKECVSKNGAMNPEQVKYIAEQVASALAAVHGENVLHRDVSPDNIMICGGGKIKLLDFGAARQVVSERSQNFSVILKPGFAPLEQYQKKGRQGPWTDIYSLGTTLYYCLTGKIPEDPMSRVEGDGAFREGLMSIDGSLRGIIGKAAALKIEDRYESADELLRDLRYGFMPPAAPGVPEVPAAVVPANNAEVPQNAAVPAEPAYAAEIVSPPAQNKSRDYEVPAYAAESGVVSANKKLFIVGGIIAALAVIIAILLTVLLSGDKKEDTVTADAETEKTTTARTYEETTPPAPAFGETTVTETEFTSLTGEEVTETTEKKTSAKTETVSETTSQTTTTAERTTTSRTETTPQANTVKIGGETYDVSMTGTLNIMGKKLTDSDIVNLKYMTNISELIISDNNITDLSAISGLTNLKKLTFHNNDVSDISFAKNLKNLTVFGAENNGIEDISALAGLKNLEELWIQNNGITDISALSGHTKLKWVSVADNLITDLTPLANCDLVRLDASYNELNGSYEAIYGLTILNEIYLTGNGYDDDPDGFYDFPYMYSDEDGFTYWI